MTYGLLQETASGWARLSVPQSAWPLLAAAGGWARLSVPQSSWLLQEAAGG